ncbi:DNA-binding transcriptional LysR family regulator [Nonomuraea polychroma]|uniref:DNA-binding transcriptional LysR family regulator n=1 Tax=Nonomuraea polychroma TaxID=46176 RepID=A0A438M4Q1_9ACTN|nr:LysR family transcriptional regulator [Nonomuraea polychroma]RVX40789.1 DNA-binding transcriptional LysR family regulator [Nonomuraea polychroma]
MDPHLLTTFVTVARRGSFSAAAAELGYTQSAISQQIAALEADLGLALLSRRPVEPTPAGRRLLEHAGPLLLRLRAARADVLRAAAGPRHRLRLAATPLAVNAAVAGRLARARAAQPRLDVTLVSCGREQVGALVAEGEADLGLADGIAAPSDPLRLPDTGPMTTVAVSEEELVVALPAGHPVAGRTALRLDDLVDARWLQTEVCPLARLRDLAGDGFPVALEYRGDDVHTVINLVAAGHGLTLLPASALSTGSVPPATRGVPLAWPRLVHRVELLHGALPPGSAADLARTLSS